MEQLATKQKERGENIQRVEINFRKDSKSRKTKERIERKLKKLEELWIEFCTGDSEIKKFQATNPEHKYFINNYHSQVRAAYESAKKLLTDTYTVIMEKGQEERAIVTSSDEEEDVGNPINPFSTSEDINTGTKSNQEFSTKVKNIIKMQASKIASFLRIIENIQAESEERKSKAYYQHKMRILQNYWGQIEQNHENLIIHAGPIEVEHDYFKANRFDEAEDIYQDAVIKLQDRCDQLYDQQSTAINLSSNTEKLTCAKIKLPPISIPTFSGNYHSWRPFYDLYAQLVHNNESLSNAQKMQYLKGNLSGEAAQLVNHLTITNENYKAAWELLLNRYENKRLLVKAQIETLLSQPDVYAESAISIKRLHDTSRECIHALQNLGINTESWDAIITHILFKKLDKESQKLYELSLKSPRQIQSLSEFFLFLELRFQSLENLKNNKREYPQKQATTKFGFTTSTKHNTFYKNYHITQHLRCEICNGNHKIFECTKFLQLNGSQRVDLVKKHNLCVNCLRATHRSSECKSEKSCKVCNSRTHNTLLHIGNQSYKGNLAGKAKCWPNKSGYNVSVSGNGVNQNKPSESTQSGHSFTSAAVPVATNSNKFNIQSYNTNSVDNGVLLATALVKIITPSGREEILRALIDQGSQACFITEDAVQRLRLQKTKVYAIITGVGDSRAGLCRSKVQFTIQSIYPSTFCLPVSALVLKCLSKTVPESEVNHLNTKMINHINLADPNAFKPGPIDVILGVDVFAEILLEGVIKGEKGFPVAQKTELGWILSGKIPTGTSKRIQCLISQVDIDDQLKQFWQSEEIPTERTSTEEENLCETIYASTVTRDNAGRYIVHLPFNEKVKSLGYSRGRAISRLLQMENKFRRNEEFYQEYRNFMREYQQLGHMQTNELNQGKQQKKETNYLPHHAVLKLDSSTTKLRVVFDASIKTSTGISLNDALLKGPQLQQDLMSILIRWRKHRFVISSDIEKMYRQIRVTEQHRNYQRILWRENQGDPIQEFNLTTVTYGTKPAPFLAIRTLHQLAQDEGADCPLAAKAVFQDFYVDDVLSGADTVSEAKLIQKQLSCLLNRGGFKLRKWTSNDMSVLAGISEADKEQTILSITDNTTIKALGVYWCPQSDTFTFKTNIPFVKTPPTKRIVLSELSRLFDPLGWLAPIIVMAKLVFQSLWVAKLSWDQELPENLADQWSRLREGFSVLETIKIPRWINFLNQESTIEIHGFCDASARAYAAVVYSRTVNKQGLVQVNLLAAKTRVSPLNKTVTIPRLELCAALLLAKLIKQVLQAIDINHVKVQAWTDSKVVLAWIQGEQSKYKTFISNRIKEINSILPHNHWHYVKSKENPADCASRGLDPRKLTNMSLWWNGPNWLKENIEYEREELCTNEEKRDKIKVFCAHNTNIFENLLNKCSNIQKLFRIISYCLRFLHNVRQNAGKRWPEYITVNELRKAKVAILKFIQNSEFTQEINDIQGNKEISRKSSLLSLNPFLDKNGLLRVGGRLRHSAFQFEGKHPIIIPHKGHLTKLIIDEAH